MQHFINQIASNTFALLMRLGKCFFIMMMLLCSSVKLLSQDSIGKLGRPIPQQISRPQDSTRTDTVLQSQPVDTLSVSPKPVDIQRFAHAASQAGSIAQQQDSAAGRKTFWGDYAYPFMRDHAYFKTTERSLLLPSILRNRPSREWVFYMFCGLLFYLAILRLAFPKYFQDLFRVFFNSSLRQKQLRDQLIQEPLPSLLMNVFFVLSGAACLYFLLEKKGLIKGYNTWMVIGFCILLIAALYLLKYLLITGAGWVFGKREASETYLFIVFMVNKIAGILVLPMAILMAYAQQDMVPVWTILLVLVLGILVLYRLVRAYSAVYKPLRINQLQFIIYVLAFEVVPILLLYKGLNRLL